MVPPALPRVGARRRAGRRRDRLVATVRRRRTEPCPADLVRESRAGRAEGTQVSARVVRAAVDPGRPAAGAAEDARRLHAGGTGAGGRRPGMGGRRRRSPRPGVDPAPGGSRRRHRVGAGRARSAAAPREAGLLARAAAWAAVGWSLVVWVLGEAFGGLLQRGRHLVVRGARSRLVYLVAAVLLLLPFRWWSWDVRSSSSRRAGAVGWGSRRCSRCCRARKAGRLPARRRPSPRVRPRASPGCSPGPSSSWPPSPRANRRSSTGRPPSWSPRPPSPCGARGARPCSSATAGVCARPPGGLPRTSASSGGLATDPNTALPLGLLIASALPGLAEPERGADDAAAGAAPGHHRRGFACPRRVLVPGRGRWRSSCPLVLVGVPARPADAAALAADSDGGLRIDPAAAAARASTSPISTAVRSRRRPCAASCSW